MKTKAIYLLMAASSFGGALLAQETKPVPPAADPFVRPAEKAPVAGHEETSSFGPAEIRLLWEVFSMEAPDAADLLREGLDGKELYEKVLERLKRKEAIQENLTALQVRSGETNHSQAVSEIIYPTEYEPPQAVEKLATDPAKKPEPAASNTLPAASPAANQEAKAATDLPATPTSFETRDCGWTFELIPILGTGNHRFIDVELQACNTVRAGVSTSGQGLSKVEMPIFDTQRLQISMTVRASKPAFAGTFNRSPVSTVDPQTSKRVWLAFVTASVVSP